ncbi:MAG TPA: hypothetical protein VG297_24165 [Bryobacteraceae bacterium]|jgi:hypothetical protein|nr:hypothetical protein [Bryobacteraceae bacterium]
MKSGAEGSPRRGTVSTVSLSFSALTFCTLVTAALAQTPQGKLELPWGRVTRLVSPNGRATIYGVPYKAGVNTSPQLWFTRARENQKLLDVPGTLSAAWSPDGNAFFVLDHEGSDEAVSYIYDAATLERLDLAQRIASSDPAARPYTHGHTYFDAESWQGNGQVLVRLHGHTDEPPVTCFDFRYRVRRDGAVTKLSARMFPAGARKGCS